MTERKSRLRSISLRVVIVLMVFFPVGVYVVTQSVNRRTAENLVRKNIKDGLRYSFDLKMTLEQMLLRTESGAMGHYDPLARLRWDMHGDRFERRLQQLIYEGGVTDAPVRFIEIYDSKELLLRCGQDSPGRVIGEVIVAYPIDYNALTERVFEVTSGGTVPGICRIVLSLSLGENRSGRLVVGLVSTNLGVQLGALAERLGTRALRLSFIGTSALALIAAYIMHLNERMRRLQLRLEEEKRLAYIGTIAAGMAHEIRNPLSSVKMNIQMIEAQLGQFGERESRYLVEKVVRIRRETARLEESVNNFLAFARPKPLQRRWTSLTETIDSVVEFLEPACSTDGIRLARDYARDLPDVFIDPDQLGQAVENLIRNAHEAIGRDGIIEIYAGRHGGFVEIRVSDNGPGIPPEIREKVFDIFFTTKEGGSGLGLTIVRQIAEAHGGSVSVDSIPKRGSTFTIRLPAGEKA